MNADAKSGRGDRADAGMVLAASVAGGLLAWSLAWFTDVGDVSLVVGAAATVGLLAIAATRGRRRPASLMIYALGFVIVTWPLLYFVVGLVRYLLTGKTLGN